MVAFFGDDLDLFVNTCYVPLSNKTSNRAFATAFRERLFLTRNPEFSVV